MFLPFKGLAYYIRKMDKLHHQSHDFQKVLKNTAAQVALMGQHSESVSTLYEIMHYTLSHRILNLSTNLAQRFMNSRMTVNVMDLRLPCSIFELCFEQGFLIPEVNVQMPSCLIVALPDTAFLSALTSVATETAQIQLDLINRQRRQNGLPMEVGRKTIVSPGLASMLCIKHRDPFELETARDGDTMPASICHCNLDCRLFKPTIDEIIEDLPLMEGLTVPMNDRDKLVQKRLVAMVFATLCYLNTAKPDIAKYKFHDRPRMGAIPPSAFIIGQNFERCPPGWHLRSAHFRTLRHERFRRDEDDKPRVVWVRSAEIGKGLEASGGQPKEETVQFQE